MGEPGKGCILLILWRMNLQERVVAVMLAAKDNRSSSVTPRIEQSKLRSEFGCKQKRKEQRHLQKLDVCLERDSVLDRGHVANRGRQTSLNASELGYRTLCFLLALTYSIL